MMQFRYCILEVTKKKKKMKNHFFFQKTEENDEPLKNEK